MLKIVDYYPGTKIPFPLEELERFGFKYHKEHRHQYEHYSVVTKKSWTYSRQLLIVVYCKDREIGVCSDYGLDILYDLIQAGLVEKLKRGRV